MTETLTPKAPENESGKEARQTYLVFARAVIQEMSVDYATLYQRFVGNDWAAIKLDEEVGKTALKAGYAPKDVVQFLHQSPYVQYQIHQKQVPVKSMTQYAVSLVTEAMQQMRRGGRSVQGRQGHLPQRELE